MKNPKENKPDKDKKSKISDKNKNVAVPIFVGKKETAEINAKEKEKKSFFSKLKDKDSRKSIKLIFREFPAKMTKEVSRIHWAKKDGSLGKKFIITLIFILIAALFFYGIDELLYVILHNAYIL